MHKKWLQLLLVVGLMLVLAACSQTAEPAPESEAPAQQEEPVVDQESEDTEIEDADVSDSEEGDLEEPDVEDQKSSPPEIDAAQLFISNCAGCHGRNRQGGSGPALLPDRLTKTDSEYAEFISNGSGRMPSFENRLSEEEIKALAVWILTPVE